MTEVKTSIRSSDEEKSTQRFNSLKRYDFPAVVKLGTRRVVKIGRVKSGVH